MTTTPWWQQAVFYQIYPRSFADANGDGIGDLRGIIDRLDYLDWLGINAIWLSPHYPSPMFDCGYDVADYAAVAPEYGTIDDFRRLLDEAHARDMRIVIDLVLNHTSHEHAWFQESRSSRNNPRRDWYIWKDPAPGGGPPNNWESTFGGSAWEWDEATGQYYYHFFLKEQPDLNWRNPEVKQAMFDTARFWLDMGVDGFRLDAIGTIYEDPAMTPHTSPYTSVDFLRYGWSWNPEERAELDIPRDAWRQLFGNQADLPEMHDLMKELRVLVDAYDDRVLIGETDDVAFLGAGDDQLHTIFNFPLMRDEPFTADWVRENQRQWRILLPELGWLCNTLNNHDGTRAFNRYTDGGPLSPAQMRLTAAALLTLPGTPFIYNGEEIGMTDYPPQNYDQVRDYLALVMRDLERARGTDEAIIFQGVQQLSRDRCRTPVQWSDAPNGGFSPNGVTPWLPVNPNYANGVNVADQRDDPDSLLHYYHRLIHLRLESPALANGAYEEVVVDQDDVLAFKRIAPDQTCLVILNFGTAPFRLASALTDGARPLFHAAGQAVPPDPALAGIMPGVVAPLGVLIAAFD
ncbi:MAG: alpha-glucosidase [Chloroflexota bacterium]